MNTVEELSTTIIKNQTSAIAFEPGITKRLGGGGHCYDDVSGTIRKDAGDNQMAVACPALTASNDPSRSPQSSEVTQQVNAVHQASMQVRRLTPRECERLMGFPDYHTAIIYKGKPAADGSRYKALGNSMAVNCMSWIGQRIQMCDEVMKELKPC